MTDTEFLWVVSKIAQGLVHDKLSTDVHCLIIFHSETQGQRLEPMCYTNSRYKLDCHLLPPGRSGLVRASYVVLFVSLVYIFPPSSFTSPNSVTSLFYKFYLKSNLEFLLSLQEQEQQSASH